MQGNELKNINIAFVKPASNIFCVNDNGKEIFGQTYNLCVEYDLNPLEENKQAQYSIYGIIEYFVQWPKNWQNLQNYSDFKINIVGKKMIIPNSAQKMYQSAFEPIFEDNFKIKGTKLFYRKNGLSKTIELRKA